MKTTFGIIIFLILLIGYIFFINEKSEYIAGEYRYYTLYEEYKAKEKYVDYTAHSYEIDTYNLKMVKNNIIEDNEKLEKYRLKLNSYNDSINLAENTVNDYERYILNLKKLKIHIEDHKKNIKNYQTDLIELNNYILKFERDLVSIDMYKSDISNINSVLKSIDSTTNKYNLSLELIKYIASSKGLALYEEIKKQNEIERENLLAKIETEREIERETEQNNRYSEYSNSLNNSNRYISNYSNYENTRSYTPPPSYNSSTNIPDISNYQNTFYSSNTNSEHIQVDGYYKSNGTYVDPYIRTAPNNTIQDNFSTSPNLNPYTGQIGTIKP